MKMVHTDEHNLSFLRVCNNLFVLITKQFNMSKNKWKNNIISNLLQNLCQNALVLCMQIQEKHNDHYKLLCTIMCYFKAGSIVTIQFNTVIVMTNHIHYACEGIKYYKNSLWPYIKEYKNLSDCDFSCYI